MQKTKIQNINIKRKQKQNLETHNRKKTEQTNIKQKQKFRARIQ